MKSASVKTSIGAVSVFCLGIASTLVAQTLTDSPQRVEQRRADLSGAPGMGGDCLNRRVQAWRNH